MMRDKGHKFWQMWSAQGWRTRYPGDAACWGRNSWEASEFFQGARDGRHCNQDWGFDKDAPAVFGFAESMHDYCNRVSAESGNGFQPGDLISACDNAGLNILRVGGWNMCKNVEWMFCAIEGRLPRRIKTGGADAPVGGAEILFSLAPRRLPVPGLENNEYFRCCGDYAENDIYFLEVCTLNEICANSDELFALNVGDAFKCQIDDGKYGALQAALTQYD